MATHIRSSLVKSRTHATVAASVTPTVAPATAVVDEEPAPRSEPPPPSGTHVRKPATLPCAAKPPEELLELDVAPDPTEPPAPIPLVAQARERLPEPAPDEPAADAVDLVAWSELTRVRRAFLARLVIGVVGACSLLCVVAAVRAGTGGDGSMASIAVGAVSAASKVTAELPRPVAEIAAVAATTPTEPTAADTTTPEKATPGAPGKVARSRASAAPKGRRTALDRP
jgi:hypothetical protein